MDYRNNTVMFYEQEWKDLKYQVVLNYLYSHDNIGTFCYSKFNIVVIILIAVLLNYSKTVTASWKSPRIKKINTLCISL